MTMYGFNCAIYVCGHYQLCPLSELVESCNVDTQDQTFTGRIAELPFYHIQDIFLTRDVCSQETCFGESTAMHRGNCTLTERFYYRYLFDSMIDSVSKLNDSATDLIRRASQLSAFTIVCVPEDSSMSDLLDQVLYVDPNRSGDFGALSPMWEHDVWRSFTPEASECEVSLHRGSALIDEPSPRAWIDAYLARASSARKIIGQKVGVLKYTIEQLEDLHTRITLLRDRSLDNDLNLPETMNARCTWHEADPTTPSLSSTSASSLESNEDEPAEYFRSCWLDEDTIGEFGLMAIKSARELQDLDLIDANSEEVLHLISNGQGPPESKHVASSQAAQRFVLGTGELSSFPFTFNYPPISPSSVPLPPSATLPPSQITNGKSSDLFILSPVNCSSPHPAELEPFPDFDFDNDPFTLPPDWALQVSEWFEKDRVLLTDWAWTVLERFDHTSLQQATASHYRRRNDSDATERGYSRASSPTFSELRSYFDLDPGNDSGFESDSVSLHDSEQDLGFLPDYSSDSGSDEAPAQSVAVPDSPLTHPDWHRVQYPDMQRPKRRRSTESIYGNLTLAEAFEKAVNKARGRMLYTGSMVAELCAAELPVHGAISRGKPEEWRFWRGTH